ncbi:hypothetical protein SX4_3274 [Vibrio mimicus SX-4]|nr:hypothetical protein SX4_3274 [Vibrio mimicus SX-4]
MNRAIRLAILARLIPPFKAAAMSATRPSCLGITLLSGRDLH